MLEENIIGQYRIVRRIGSGGMAFTYLCSRDGFGGFQKHVLIKMLDPARLEDPRFIHMFLDEARLWAKFNHPNIPQVFELGEHNGVPYIVMEYVPGPTLHMLSRKLTERTPRDLCFIARIGADVARALDYAFFGADGEGAKLGVIHRDVTLTNILVSTSGQAKLIDFGISLADGRIAFTEVGTLKGRIQYMAPEQLLEQPVDHRTDIFQLGITLYHLTTGRAAYGNANKGATAVWKARMENQVTPVLTAAPTCPPDLARIVEQCIHPQADQRFARAAMLAEALDNFVVATMGHAITPDELAAWIHHQFPNKEWQTTSSSSAGPFTGSSHTIPSHSPIAMVTTAQPRLRGRFALIAALLVGGVVVLGGVGAGLAAAIVAVQMEWFHQENPVPADAADDPNRAATVFLDEAERLIGVDRDADAAAFVDKAQQADPTDAEVVVRLARVASEVDDRRLLASARQALAEGDRAAAADQARSLLDRRPTDPDALAILEQVSAANREAAPPDAAPSAKGTLVVRAQPPALVFVDDRPYGTTPVTLNLATGAHDVDLRLAGHTAVRRSVTVRGNDSVSVDVVLDATEPVVEPPVPAEVAPTEPATASDVAPEPEVPVAPAPAEDAVAVVEPVAPAPTPPDVQFDPASLDLVSDVPVPQQALVLLRALAFDSKLRARSGDKLVIASLFVDPATKKRAFRMNSEFETYTGRVQGMSLNVSAVEYTDQNALSASISQLGIDVLYVPTGLGAQVGGISAAARGAGVLTIGAEPSYVRSGLTLGVFTLHGEPKLAFNARSAAAAGAAFEGEILDVAVRMD